MPRPAVGVRIRGLREFQRALRRADGRLSRWVRGEFRAVAGRVVTRARSLAYQKNDEGTGDLGRGIRPFSRQGSVGVASTARHDGYDYPRRLEFEHGFPYGPRASLWPAAEESETMLETEAHRILNQLADQDLSGRPF